MNNRLIKSNDAGGGACTNTVDLYNPFPDGGGVALYQLNGDATDVSGNYDGTATNVTYGTGQFGQAGVFNGSSSKIILPSGINTLLGNKVFSVSLWVKDNGSASDVVFSTGGANTFFLSANWTSAGNYALNKGGVGDTTIVLGAVTTNWSHIVLNSNGSSGIEAFFNGVSKGVLGYRVADDAITSIGDLRGGGFWFNGSIDQVRIFSRALRPYEVEALYTEEYCTPTIVPSEHFNTVTYTGTGSTGTQISVGFQPDFVWFKNRSDTDWHILQDSVRGVDKSLFSNATDAEETYANFIQQFNATGYTIGSDAQINQSGLPYVSWNFKAGGAAVDITSESTNVSIASRSANAEAGFSILTYTPSAAPQDIAHGLNSKPSIYISKRRDSASDWYFFTDLIDGSWDYLLLNSTDASGESSGLANDTTIRTAWASGNILTYCFAEVEGFSSFGSYVGTGANTNAIVTGFEPAFLLVKQTNTARNWYVMDNKRNPENPKSKLLFPNDAGAEFTGSGDTFVDFLENGFEITPLAGDAINQSGGSYIYMAFAADPTAVEPSLEDSFNTVLFNGDNTASKFIDVGFTPDFLWLKSRDVTISHALYDSVRGDNLRLVSNGTGGEGSVPNEFADNGFNIIGGSGYNDSSLGDQVAWAWKGAEIPAINSNGSIPSVVSANPAAGFSIVSWRAGSSIGNVGHGLNSAPEIIIVKQRDGIQDWWVWHSQFNGNQAVKLNTTDATINNPNIFGGTDMPNENTFAFNGSSGADYIAYVFHSVAGFSKIGFWQGGTTSIDLGFEPAFVLNQDYGAGGSWGMYDSVRGFDKALLANSSNAEVSSTFITPNATGFTVPSESSIVFRLYMAFANQF